MDGWLDGWLNGWLDGWMVVHDQLRSQKIIEGFGFQGWGFPMILRVFVL